MSWAIADSSSHFWTLPPEAVRGQVGEVEGQYRRRRQDVHGASAAVDLHHQRTERLIVFGAQRRQVAAGIGELAVDVGHLPPELVGRRQVVGHVGDGFSLSVVDQPIFGVGSCWCSTPPARAPGVSALRQGLRR
ncbi:MAG: hypothetical protein ACXVX1_07560 [Mycobacterium sp.]